jgi:hypothetical protein
MRGEVFVGILCFSIFILISAFSLILENASGIESEGELSISFEPGTPNLNIGKGKSINFSVNVSVPNETDVSDITYMWTLDSIPVDISNDEPNIICILSKLNGKPKKYISNKYLIEYHF